MALRFFSLKTINLTHFKSELIIKNESFNTENQYTKKHNAPLEQ